MDINFLKLTQIRSHIRFCSTMINNIKDLSIEKRSKAL